MLDRRRAGPIAASATVLFGLLIFLAASAWSTAEALRTENESLLERNESLLKDLRDQQESFAEQQRSFSVRIAQLEEEIRRLGGVVPAPVDVRIQVDDNETTPITSPSTTSTSTTSTTMQPTTTTTEPPCFLPRPFCERRVRSRSR